uniref:Peptidase C1A papain C-terminal domain-containing protein n=1 Tax=viral metagenome TaxID=1070528 RepID=A0A6C0B995_9ZZZZ
MPKRVYNVKIERMHKSKLNHLTFSKPAAITASVDLRAKMPLIYDQGSLGSCTANALCGLLAYDNSKIQGSILFVYYNERVIEGTIKEDAGATLEDGVKSLIKYGVCLETDWPYNISKFAVCPPPKCYTNALQHRVLQKNTRNIKNDLKSMKQCLSNKLPFVVGILVYESFESQAVATTGMVPMPNTQKEKLLGGHAILCVGYNDKLQVWIMRNSWGSTWGDKGYFYLPYAYLLSSDLSSDLWTISDIR